MVQEKDNPPYLNDFLDYMITIQNKSPNTIKEYNYDLATFLRFLKIHFNLTSETELKNIRFNDVSIEILKQVTLEDLHSFLGYLTKNFNSKATTRSRKVSSLRIFFNYLCQQKGLLQINPTQNLETPKIGKRLPKYLSLDDSKKLLSVAANEDNRNSERNYAITTLFLNCGMRLSELVGININDIRFEDWQMKVIGKGNKERTIYLNKACIHSIQNYLNVRPKKGLSSDGEKALFLSERKQRISKRAVQQIIYSELRQAGLDTTKYSVLQYGHTG